MDVAIEDNIILLIGWDLNSDVNKDLKCKMKAKTKELSFKDIDTSKTKIVLLTPHYFSSPEFSYLMHSIC